MQSFKGMDFKGGKEKKSDDLQILKKISVKRDEDIDFLEKSLKVDASLVHSPVPEMASKDGSPGKGLPPLMKAQTPILPGGAADTRPESTLQPIPESTFNLETDFFSAPKTKMPT